MALINLVKSIVSLVTVVLFTASCGVFDAKVAAPNRDDSEDRLKTSNYKPGSAAALTLNPLSDLDIFIRCYSQLTGFDIDPSDKRIAAIKSHKLSGRYACRELFKSVNMGSGGELIAPTDETQAILSRMHKINSSFFLAQSLAIESNPDFTKVKENLLDPSSPALFFTKALFTKDQKFDDIFRGNQNLMPTRRLSLSLESQPQNPRLKATLLGNASIFGANFIYQKVGFLTGISENLTLQLTYTPGANFYPSSDGNVDFGRAFGGGILGSPVYLQNNALIPTYGNGAIAPATSGAWDGGVHIGRRWSVAVFKDFLCQDLPSLSPGDVSSPEYVSSESPAPFRNSASCSACHASMDQMAGAIRNIGYLPHGVKDAAAGATANIGTTELFQIAPGLSSQPDEWPFQPDADYSKRPPTGRLMYRTSDGNLINEKFSGLSELGELMASQNDVYRCVTKRYMEYFMSVKIPMRSTLKDANKDIYIDELNRLSAALKEHKNLNRLVDQVLMSNLYGSK